VLKKVLKISTVFTFIGVTKPHLKKLKFIFKFLLLKRVILHPTGNETQDQLVIQYFMIGPTVCNKTISLEFIN